MTRNASHIPAHIMRRRTAQNQGKRTEYKGNVLSRAPNKGVLEHERKRKMELRLMQHRVRLEDSGKYSEAEIDRRVGEMRDELEVKRALREEEEKKREQRRKEAMEERERLRKEREEAREEGAADGEGGEC